MLDIKNTENGKWMDIFNLWIECQHMPLHLLRLLFPCEWWFFFWGTYIYIYIYIHHVKGTVIAQPLPNIGPKINIDHIDSLTMLPSIFYNELVMIDRYNARCYLSFMLSNWLVGVSPKFRILYCIEMWKNPLGTITWTLPLSNV